MGRWSETMVVAALVGLATTVPASAAWELTIDAPPSLAGAAGRLARVNSDALEAVLQRAGLALPPVVRVALVPEGDARAREVPAWVVGRALGVADVLIFPERVAAYPYDSIESVLRHEVVHLALFASAAGQPLPRWFHEGVAVSVDTGWSVADSIQLLLAAARGPAIADVTRLFRSGAEPDTAEAYRLATSLVEDLRRRHGPAIPGAIAAHVARGLPFSRAFEVETGETPDQAAGQAWAGYRRLALWLPVLTSGTSVWMLILGLSFVAFFFRLRQRSRKRRLWDGEEDEIDR